MNNKELIEFVFYHEKEIKVAIYEKRLDGCVPHTGGNGGHCRVSDITANKAINNVMPVYVVLVEYGIAINGKRSSFALKYPEQWLKVIAGTKEQFSDTQRGEILKAKFQDAERRIDTSEKLGISVQAYSAMLSDVMTFAEGYASGLGLISPKR